MRSYSYVALMEKYCFSCAHSVQQDLLFLILAEHVLETQWSKVNMQVGQILRGSRQATKAARVLPNDREWSWHNPDITDRFYDIG